MTANQNALPVNGGQPQDLPKPILAPAVKRAREVIQTVLPKYWPCVRGCLAVATSLRLAELDLCPTLVINGPSGVGKGSITEMLDGGFGIVRVDSVTPACFVSSSANVSAAHLEKQDILPLIQHKVMLMRDFATIARQNAEQQKSLFGILTPILDGKGYAPGSGTQGLRSVTGNYLFGWIIAALPWRQQTWATQKQFGSRLHYYDLFKPPNMTDEEVLAERSGEALSAKIDLCRTELRTVLALIFLKRADGVTKSATLSVHWGKDPADLALWRVKLARLLVAARHVKGNIEEDDEDDPQRTISGIEVITRGNAMLDDRTIVTAEDFPLAVHVALSGSLHGRVLRALAMNPGGLSVKDCATTTGWSEQTAKNRMDKLVQQTGDNIVKWVDPATVITGRGRPTEQVLSPVGRWSWLWDLKGYGWVE